MKYYIIILISILTLSCQTRNNKHNNIENSKIDLLFESTFEHSLISRGNNFPDFQPEKDSMDFFLISLHQNIPISDFKKKTKLTDSQINKIEKLLETKNWLHYINGKPEPSVFIATQKDGDKLFKSSIPIANKVVAEIQKELPGIKLKFDETEISKTQDFEKWSFLILSNVLLDSWQIDNVEKYYLNKENRPNRHGKNYYYSIMENTDKTRETFGLYGNNRLNISLKQSENEISKSDNEIFSKIANDFKPKLIDILNSEDNYIRKIYKETGYQKEIVFEEFFIWWYHFIYTRATEIMNDNNMLIIPESGNFEYQIRE